MWDEYGAYGGNNRKTKVGEEQAAMRATCPYAVMRGEEDCAFLLLLPYLLWYISMYD
jgi:hypothetical protein